MIEDDADQDSSDGSESDGASEHSLWVSLITLMVTLMLRGG